jgi:winged helix DNA-binding protein
VDEVEIVHRRLRQQYLSGPPLADPVAMLRHFGAMQAQEYAVAKWGIGQRTGVDDATVQGLIDSGGLLRTHALRPTWHFVAGVDLGWIQALTGPRVQLFNAHYNKLHGLDDEVAVRTNRVITTALAGGNHLTRPELAAALEQAGLPAVGNRLAYVVMRAELDGLIANGIMRGKQHTYALVAERVADPVELKGDEALAEFTRRYFTSHGPATVKDFAWWSSLTVTQIRRGLGLLGGELASETIGGRQYWFRPGPEPGRDKGPVALLLQGYDEYGIGYSESRPLINRAGRKIAPDNPNQTIHPIVLDSQVVGWWRRAVGRTGITVIPVLAVELTAAQRKAIEGEAARYATFAGQPVTVAWP